MAMKDHIVEQGESVASIAFASGFFWETLWNLSENADLNSLRVDPNILQPGDVLHVPDVRVKQSPAASQARHTYTLKGVPCKFKLHLLRGDKPRSNLNYQFRVDNDPTIQGVTDGDGWITQPISPTAKKVTLTLLPDGQPPEVHVLNLSCVDPIDTLTGAQSRLANLGYYFGEVTGVLDDETASALSNFQKANNLPISGAFDAATQGALKDKHKS